MIINQKTVTRKSGEEVEVSLYEHDFPEHPTYDCYAGESKVFQCYHKRLALTLMDSYIEVLKVL